VAAVGSGCTAWLAELSVLRLAVAAIGVALQTIVQTRCAAQTAGTRGCLSQDRVELELEPGCVRVLVQHVFELDSSKINYRNTGLLRDCSEFVAAVDALGRRRHRYRPLGRDLLPRQLHQQVVPVLVGGLESSRHALGRERHVRAGEARAALR